MPDPFAERREALVASLRRRGHLSEEKVTNAMRKVERHLFVPEDLVHDAYRDTPLHIGLGQTISAPHMVAIMLELLEIEEGQKVLEVGTGSGYNAALLAELVGKKGVVFSVERLEALAKIAEENIAKAGYGDTVKVRVSDGSLGLLDEAPFDRIVVTAASPKVPGTLQSQLVDGGILLIPVGSKSFQRLLKVIRIGDAFEESIMGEVIFVPLIGEYGHQG